MIARRVVSNISNEINREDVRVDVPSWGKRKGVLLLDAILGRKKGRDPSASRRGLRLQVTGQPSPSAKRAYIIRDTKSAEWGKARHNLLALRRCW
jgi:hypothetical protein